MTSRLESSALLPALPSASTISSASVLIHILISPPDACQPTRAKLTRPHPRRYACSWFSDSGPPAPPQIPRTWRRRPRAVSRHGRGCHRKPLQKQRRDDDWRSVLRCRKVMPAAHTSKHSPHKARQKVGFSHLPRNASRANAKMRVPFLVLPILCVVVGVYSAPPPANPNLKPCGDAYYLSSQYTCYNGDFLCPVLNGEATLRCGLACYRPEMYGCVNGELVYPPTGGAAASSPGSPGSVTASSGLPAGSSASNSSSSGTAAAAVCTETPTTQHLSDPPYENYFYSVSTPINEGLTGRCGRMADCCYRTATVQTKWSLQVRSQQAISASSDRGCWSLGPPATPAYWHTSLLRMVSMDHSVFSSSTAPPISRYRGCIRQQTAAP